MLTADLVRYKISRGRLSIVELKGKPRERALLLAEAYLTLAKEQVGGTREQLKLAWSGVEVGPRERKLAMGLQKLIEDRCGLEADAHVNPAELRSSVFLAATQLRRQHGRDFASKLLLEPLAEQHQLTPSAIETALYSDLPSQHVLTAAPGWSPEGLLEHFDRSQIQAVLLRAVSVTARVSCRDVSAYRQLFRTLKFRRLLYRIERDQEGDGYRIDIDGPFSLFESTTKYGVQLALMFDALCRCDRLQLSAELKWGKERYPAQFEYSSELPSSSADEDGDTASETLELQRAIERTTSSWRVRVNEEILHLPGVGLCVPDLCLTRGEQKIFIEVLGFWSRDAVWKRVELTEKGLGARVVFAVSSRLRVSEEALDETQSASLYVYKGSINPRSLLERVETLSLR